MPLSCLYHQFLWLAAVDSQPTKITDLNRRFVQRRPPIDLLMLDAVPVLSDTNQILAGKPSKEVNYHIFPCSIPWMYGIFIYMKTINTKQLPLDLIVLQRCHVLLVLCYILSGMVVCLVEVFADYHLYTIHGIIYHCITISQDDVSLVLGLCIGSNFCFPRNKNPPKKRALCIEVLKTIVP